MKVIDFIKEKADSMNEKDYFSILYLLADQYGFALREKGFAPSCGLSDRRLLTGFLMQDIHPLDNGKYTLLKIRV